MGLAVGKVEGGGVEGPLDHLAGGDVVDVPPGVAWAWVRGVVVAALVLVDEIPVQTPGLRAVTGRKAVQRGEGALLEGALPEGVEFVDAVFLGAGRSVTQPCSAMIDIQGRGDTRGSRDGVENLDLATSRIGDGAGGERDTADTLAVGEAALDGIRGGLRPEPRTAVDLLVAVADAPEVHDGADGAFGSDLVDTQIAAARAVGIGCGAGSSVRRRPSLTSCVT
ncbi:hypothetical protein ACH4ZU_25910 [Streptomyces sp. NPDC020472]|uniref:hypothetical protein n=1 Tax=Streptomyces sp. NPDC020472 TaxID=3365075 RepID=UPI0037A6FA1F